jgi:hypothetical protein
MKVSLIILLVVLVLLLSLPLAVGMEMTGGSCPACTATERPLTWGMCLAVIAFMAFVVRFSSFRLFLKSSKVHEPPPAPSLFRPPRTI